MIESRAVHAGRPAGAGTKDGENWTLVLVRELASLAEEKSGRA